MADEYRLAFSTITKGALEGSDAYLLRNFPVQADQGSIYKKPWGPPIDEGTTYPSPSGYIETLGVTQEDDGTVDFDWTLGYLTENMVGYINAQAFSSAPWKAVTIKTLCEDGVYRCYHASFYKPRENTDYKRFVLGVLNYKMRFRGGVLLP